MTEGHGFTEGDYLLGIEGLAILRASYERDFGTIQTRREEIRKILDAGDEGPYGMRRDLPTSAVQDGYTVWADSYDRPEDDADPIEETETPVMRRLMDELPEGPILDAACGTGRHTAYLLKIGHKDVKGTDLTPAMLDIARKKCPDVDFQQADLNSLPFENESFVGIVCGLAFSHISDLEPPSKELARVLRSGGRLFVSAPHPYITGVLGWRAPAFDEEGNGTVMPEYYNTHQEYIAAFTAAGLIVKQCIEPRLSPAQARWNPDKHASPEDAAPEQALTGQPSVFVWDLLKP
jgi:ubiquinone/menaquinone biosynthesis C-methylase UbiE